ncbi:MAG: hypothetical protein MSC30_11495 [Gaiellaceae bacterium MAG52_C11]|nr:hypothetical protein [Candidatus Gaiellasilicea maunaloa]
MDKLKAMFTGGSDSPDHSHDGHDHHDQTHDHDHGVAVDDVPPAPAAPLDPLGTTMPEAGPVPTSIPPADDQKP